MYSGANRGTKKRIPAEHRQKQSYAPQLSSPLPPILPGMNVSSASSSSRQIKSEKAAVMPEVGTQYRAERGRGRGKKNFSKQFQNTKSEFKRMKSK